MARQPDIQYIQMYNYGSTARKVAPRPQAQKEKYQLPEQQPRKVQTQKKLLDPLSFCAVAVSCVILVALAIGVFRLGELTTRRYELQQHIEVLQRKQAGLYQDYEEICDFQQVEQRARQMGMIGGNEAVHVQMGAVNPEPQQEPGFLDRMEQLFDELFAKAPR